MEGGRLLAPHPVLTAVRDYCAAQVASLPEEVRRLHDAATYPLSYSQRLVSLQRLLEAQVEATEVVPMRRGGPSATEGAVPPRGAGGGSVPGSQGSGR